MIVGKIWPALVALALLVACDHPYPLIPDGAPDGVQLGFVCRLDKIVVLRGFLIVPDWAGDAYLDPVTGEQVFASKPATCDSPGFDGVACTIEPVRAP